MRPHHWALTGMAGLFAAMLGRMGWIDWYAVGHAVVLVAFCLVVLVVVLLGLATPFLVVGGALWLLAEVFSAPAAGPVTSAAWPEKKAASASKPKERSLSNQHAA